MSRNFPGEYPPNWPEISKACKDAAGWRCVRCGHPHDPKSGHTLTVHHLDGNKANCEWWNLAALCQKCHLHIQAKVIMERRWFFEHSPWFKPYVAGFYANQYGQPTNQNYVLAHLDQLIAIGQGRPL